MIDKCSRIWSSPTLERLGNVHIPAHLGVVGRGSGILGKGRDFYSHKVYTIELLDCKIMQVIRKCCDETPYTRSTSLLVHW